MSEPTAEERLAADLEALCEKHDLDSGMVAVTRDTHFLIITCNMEPKVMHMLGHTLVHNSTPPPNAVLN